MRAIAPGSAIAEGHRIVEIRMRRTRRSAEQQAGDYQPHEKAMHARYLNDPGPLVRRLPTPLDQGARPPIRSSTARI